MVSSADTPIASVKALKGFRFPGTHIRWRPRVTGILTMKRRRAMAHVERRDGLTASDRANSFAHWNAVHHDGVAGKKIARGEFMLCRNIRGESKGLLREI